MIDCPHCLENVSAVRELEPAGGYTETCPKCSGRIGTVLPKRSQSVQPMQQVEPVTSVAVVLGAPPSPVASIRARLAAVDAQIPTAEQLKALRRERAGLMRALRALGAE